MAESLELKNPVRQPSANPIVNTQAIPGRTVFYECFAFATGAIIRSLTNQYSGFPLHKGRARCLRAVGGTSYHPGSSMRGIS